MKNTSTGGDKGNVVGSVQVSGTIQKELTKMPFLSSDFQNLFFERERERGERKREISEAKKGRLFGKVGKPNQNQNPILIEMLSWQRSES